MSYTEFASQADTYQEVILDSTISMKLLTTAVDMLDKLTDQYPTYAARWVLS